MIGLARFYGMKVRTASNGKKYALIYCHSLSPDGTADFEQSKFLTFSARVIAKCETLKQGDDILLDLQFKDATIQEVHLSDEIEG